MSDDWMPNLQLPLTREQFDQLPRHASYRYSYFDDTAWINPRPRYYHVVLDFADLDANQASDVPLRPLQERDWESLVQLFALTFHDQQPFAGQPSERRAESALRSINQTRHGGDGPLIERASFVAIDHTATPIGAALLTLLPPGDPLDWDGYSWLTPPPDDCIETLQGRPHLSWIFVHPEWAGRGVGTALLRAAADALEEIGYDSLLSTFLLGNESSMLWHWRIGFRLLTYPGSPRRYMGSE